MPGPGWRCRRAGACRPPGLRGVAGSALAQAHNGVDLPPAMRLCTPRMRREEGGWPAIEGGCLRAATAEPHGAHPRRRRYQRWRRDVSRRHGRTSGRPARNDVAAAREHRPPVVGRGLGLPWKTRPGVQRRCWRKARGSVARDPLPTRCALLRRRARRGDSARTPPPSPPRRTTPPDTHRPGPTRSDKAPGRQRPAADRLACHSAPGDSASLSSDIRPIGIFQQSST